MIKTPHLFLYFEENNHFCLFLNLLMGEIGA